MSQNFTVNGKEYLQSNVLAVTFGYSSDYLGKLAREEKILGTQIGRQWFIEPESLKTFLAKSAIEKELRKEELSLKRKIEHAGHSKKQFEETRLNSGLSATAFAQTAVIVLCGLFVGGLGYVAVDANLDLRTLSSGTGKSVAYIAESLSPIGKQHVKSLVGPTQLAASTEGVVVRLSPRPQTNEIFAILPEFPERTGAEVYATSTAETVMPALQTLTFSDEVRIVFDENGNQFIEPVFKRTSSTSRFMLVPAKNLEN